MFDKIRQIIPEQIRKFEPGLSYRTKTCQNAALCRPGVCSDETAACLFLVFDKSVALHLVEIIESDTQSLSGFEFSSKIFHRFLSMEICKERIEFCPDSLNLVEIIESDMQSLSGFEFSTDFFYMESEICKERLRFEFWIDG